MNRWLLIIVVMLGLLLAVWFYGRGERGLVQLESSVGDQLVAPELGRLLAEEERPLDYGTMMDYFSRDRPEVVIVEDEAEQLEDLPLLERMTRYWLYRSFIQTSELKLGFIEKANTASTFSVEEGNIYQGITVKELDSRVALLTLGDQTRELLLTRTSPPEQFPVMPLPSSPEQAADARRYYDANWGDDFREQGKDYIPQPGEIMPPLEPPTPEEEEAGMRDYFNNVWKPANAKRVDQAPSTSKKPYVPANPKDRRLMELFNQMRSEGEYPYGESIDHE